ncbi:flavin monoamine oxidase family protein [soil metagenome]
MQHAKSFDSLPKDIDVIVVGAGLAGLIAARDLAAHGSCVVVLEGRDRVGGRIFARELVDGSAKVDFGGTWIIPTEHTAVMSELERYAIRVAPTPEPTRFITELNGTLSDQGFLTENETEEIGRAFELVKRNADASATADQALRSVGLDEGLFAWVEATNRYISGASLSELSGVDCASMPPSDVADPDHYTHVIDATAQTLIDAVADSSQATLLLNSEVTAVHATADGFVVSDQARNRLAARDIVLAVPVNVLADIDFGTPIDAAAALGKSGHAGHSVKLWMTVRNVDGWPRIFAASGPIAYARVERYLDSGDALLVGFSDDPAMADASAQEIQTALRAVVPHIEVLAVDSHDWNADHFARGTWMAVRPGQLRQVGILNSPLHTNGIHFAGADLCVDAQGTIEGAIISGKRAAAQIDSAEWRS